MENSTILQQQGYKGIKVTSMIQALEQKEMFQHLRLVQQNEFSRIKNRYNKLGYLTQPYFSYLWNLYWNFVLNDFRFDSDNNWQVVSKIQKVEHQHIGMKIFNSFKS